jgi:hypothetical protein
MRPRLVIALAAALMQDEIDLPKEENGPVLPCPSGYRGIPGRRRSSLPFCALRMPPPSRCSTVAVMVQARRQAVIAAKRQLMLSRGLSLHFMTWNEAASVSQRSFALSGPTPLYSTRRICTKSKDLTESEHPTENNVVRWLGEDPNF